ncbi:Mad3/BUB1 homology region 1-domain-containing protein [Apodospora peruviana]|uniref:Mad3/BUB1 homology region 1-domain-containing protein n=1 Tax=Apodospora peruviana TaxID=516989 RepID=A0AAE0IR70_9PEZI|nr:Mad3/BUB1 homology region 1-domain-containing protein [Apodospora peruviana]
MASNDLINFDVIESQKENIQALPSGRSAKKLAELFSPTHTPLARMATPPNPSDTKNVNDAIRAEYEAEIATISEHDDPLDVYDRYVRWTLDAYPSAQATRESQLHLLLERATKSFVGAPQYKNDPRYLKMWLHYTQLFSDSPRETFVFLSRHSIGETLALFYEEYAAWLEGAGRWAQAEEVYKLGIEREARPTSRLLRKFGEFEQRRAMLPEADVGGPSSPALPTVRPALAAKIDPFVAAAAAARDPQAPRPNSGVGGQAAAKSGRSKLTIFSDADAPPAAPALSTRGAGSKGWDSIGSLADRKKENVVEAKPWVGETLKAGGKKRSGPKLDVFRDTFMSQQLSQSHIPIHHSKVQVTVNPATGKKERVFVDLRVVYPTPDEPGTELSFEEVWAARRGWLGHEWEPEIPRAASPVDDVMHMDENFIPEISQKPSEKLMVHHDVVRLDENGTPIYPKENSKPRKKKVIEVNETQIIKAKLDSPSRPKMMKRKQPAEPTMTLHTKAATDDIYDIFNAPLQPEVSINDGSDDDYETDDYTSGAESTGTTRNITTSEAGDVDEVEEEEEEEAEVESSDVKSLSEWSDFSTRRHIPDLDAPAGEQNNTQVSDLIDIHDEGHDSSGVGSNQRDQTPEEDDEEDDGYVGTPGEDLPPRTKTVFVPIPPEDYVPSRRTYRDPMEMANNRLPFMTPITERTESSLDFTANLLAKTPCKKDARRGVAEEDENEDMERDLLLEQLSSPLREVIEEDDILSPKVKVPQPLLQKQNPGASAVAVVKKPLGPKAAAPLAPKAGPIIMDAQCNPVDDSVRAEILENIHPPLSSYEAFYDHRTEKYEKGGEIRKFVKAMAKSSRNSRRSSSDNTNGKMLNLTITSTSVPVIQFTDDDVSGRSYTVKKELGKGAFAPVYLVENLNPSSTAVPTSSDENDENNNQVVMGRGAFALAHHHRHEREALKMELPPTPWEFYMMRLAHARLGPHHRATASLSPALEMHLYQDEGFLFLPYYPHGTLLDVVNFFRAEPSGVMDETLVMFFVVELFRTVEALHKEKILHGDLKVDNCLLRLGSGHGVYGTHEGLSGAWRADGKGGWSSRGVTLIDFGRAIDIRAFRGDVQFIADWKTSAQDCAEMREGRPWTWQIDYHGLAGIVHCLLFGKYIETVRCDNGGIGGGKRYKIRESLKRYWQTEIWGECFDLLLNPGGFVAAEEGGKMPVLKSMRAVREKMESWLEGNCERGVGLRSLMGKVEAWATAQANKGKK